MSRAARDSGPAPLSSRAVQLQVLSDALQHPTTLYPFGAAALGAIYAAFVAPFLGGGAYAVVGSAVAGLTAAASFYWHYFARGEQYARMKVRALLAEQEARGRDELDELRRGLAEGFESLDSTEGGRALMELAREYSALRQALEQHGAGGLASAERIAASADATYREGLQVLADLLGVLRAADQGDVKVLEAELAELREEVEALQRQGASVQRIRIKEQTIASHQERLDFLGKQRMRAEELLHLSDSCEAALHKVRLQIPALTANWTEREATQAADSLLRIVDSARRVQERLSESPVIEDLRQVAGDR